MQVGHLTYHGYCLDCGPPPKEVSGLSSAEAVYGQPLVLPRELAPGCEAAAQDFSEKLQSADPPATQQPRTWAQVAASPKQPLLKTSLAYVKRGAVAPPLSPPYEGPFEVVKHGPKFWTLKIGDRMDKITTDRIKPHRGRSLVEVAQPPVRGRPRKVLPDQSRSST